MKQLLEDWVARGVTPGGVLSYGDRGREPVTIPFGRTQSHPQPGVEVVADTIYDCASITKPVATVATLMKLVEAGTVDLDAPVVDLLPELTIAGGGAIRVRHLVGHASGLPAHVEFFKRILAGDLAGAANRREAILRMAATTELTYRPGSDTIYSDLGFILLGFYLERAGGDRLDQLVDRLVAGPLGMTATRYVDLDADPVAHPRPVAATEICPYRGLVAGEVHDDNAHSAGGILGHAGLFSTAGDLGKFARAILAAWLGEDGWFAPPVVRHFLSHSAAPATRFRLGWDRPGLPPALSHAGDRWPREGFGHLGFTGCSLWLDPGPRRYVVLLTNRVHPSREEPRIRELRRSVMDGLVEQLDATAR